MKRLFRDAQGSVLAPRGSVVAIGAFDGIHRGHQHLLARVRDRAAALALDSAAVSFEPLPRQYFQGRDGVTRLASPRQRIREMLSRVDRLGLLRFDKRLAETEAEAFVADVLVERLRTKEVWVGPGFRFGRGRRGDIAMLQALGALHGFVANEVESIESEGARISATRIRAALLESRFAEAETLLGRPFTMGGHVVRGAQLGRKLGYPTANLRIPYGRAPVHGIFAVRVNGPGLDGWPAVASLGTRPTVAGTEPLLEAHLFDFDGDLYGRLLSLEFVAKLRDERHFASLDALVAQMDEDSRAARAALDEQTIPGVSA
ncbi:MAG TPA: bifunctional riboflavin kinase/FAD synthetase [Xanthomonadales bacterium]|nr:bifunctional riboflavin kinase/FAD synthetase [Xanthomonadales bacterium]